MARRSAATNRIQIFQLNNFGSSSISEMTYVDQIQKIRDLSGPMAVAFAYEDAKQVIYIADTGNDRILKIEVEYDRPTSSPMHVWELLKAALWADQLDEALTFFADIASEKYAVVLEDLRSEFQNMVNGMGNLILISSEAHVKRYEMLHDEGGSVIAAFPVYFIKDGDGNWKIYCF